MNILYIGLGAMGSALAGRLLDHHTLSVWDLNSAAVAFFVQRGAMPASDTAMAVRDADIVMLCLPRSADVHQAIFGAGGMATQLRPGQLVIDQTSGTPRETERIAAELVTRGVDMVAAPVSGNPGLVSAGRATIMASGNGEACERALPVLERLAAHVLHCGPRVGDAQAMKLVNNTINAGCRLATLETAALGRALGLSLVAITQALNAGLGRNRPSEVMLPALQAGRPASDFRLELMLKDVNQTLSLARELGVAMPLASLVRGLHQIGVNTLGEHAQLDQVAELMETMTATRIAAPGGAENGEAIATVQALGAACNIALSWEAVHLARQYGLTLPAIASVLAVSSGGTGATPDVLAIDEGRALRPLLRPWLPELNRAAEAAARLGAPLLLGEAVRSQAHG